MQNLYCSFRTSNKGKQTDSNWFYVWGFCWFKRNHQTNFSWVSSKKAQIDPRFSHWKYEIFQPGRLPKVLFVRQFLFFLLNFSPKKKWRIFDARFFLLCLIFSPKISKGEKNSDWFRNKSQFHEFSWIHNQDAIFLNNLAGIIVKGFFRYFPRFRKVQVSSLSSNFLGLFSSYWKLKIKSFNSSQIILSSWLFLFILSHGTNKMSWRKIRINFLRTAQFYFKRTRNPKCLLKFNKALKSFTYLWEKPFDHCKLWWLIFFGPRQQNFHN